MDLDPRILKIDGKEELVVMTMSDYRRLRQAVTDAEDLLAIRAARKANRGKPTYTIEEARQRLGLTKASAQRKSRTRQKRSSSQP